MKKKLYWIIFAYTIFGGIWATFDIYYNVSFWYGFIFWIFYAGYTDLVVIPWIIKGLMKQIEICIVRKVDFISSQPKKGNSLAKRPSSNDLQKAKNTQPKKQESKNLKQVKNTKASKK